MKRPFSEQLRTAALCAGAAMIFAGWACLPAQAEMTEKNVPATSVVPAAPAAGAPAAKPSPAAAAVTPKHHAAVPVQRREVKGGFEVEPANARLKVLKDTPIYSEPARSSKKIETAHEGKYVIVTGSTHYYLRVRLKSGKIGYVEPAAVDLVKPTDKLFHLTSNAAVLDKPNRWGKRLSEVHKGHDVYVVGIALSYVRIRMKSGLEGFIPMKALE